jgi:sugar (pentulose or hexulose) kinase
MDLRSGQWARRMLHALEKPLYRRLAWAQLPRIIDQFDPIGPLSESLAIEAGIPLKGRPLLFPTSDDQQAGLVGGGAVDAGQVAVILGNSAVVNSSSQRLLPADSRLDAMALNWGPYLWMRCYNNGAQFLDHVVGVKPDWKELEKAARAFPPGAGGVMVLPFVKKEPSFNITRPRLEWAPAAPAEMGRKYRASLEALAYLIARAIREHEQAGQQIARITVSGGIARSDLMCRILASVLNRPLQRLISDEGPALGAAVTALAALETHLRRQEKIKEPYTMTDAVGQMVKFRDTVPPNPEWVSIYRTGLERFLEKCAG